MSDQDHLVRIAESPASQCPLCDSSHVDSRIENQTFVHGTGKDASELSAPVQVFQCQSCMFEFTDETAEKARHNAVCRHLGVLTPEEIAAIRAQYKLSRAEFARITRIGEASINRWENGQLIQNAAMDQYLRLLSQPEIFQEMQNQNQTTVQHNPHTTPKFFQGVFVSLDVTTSMLHDAREFSLH